MDGFNHGKCVLMDTRLAAMCVQRQTCTWVFDGVEQVFPLYSRRNPACALGTVGQLTLIDGFPESFEPYPDQALRRQPEFDDATAGVHGWRRLHGASGLLYKANVVPPRNGVFRLARKETVNLGVPQAFLDSCRRLRLRPECVVGMLIFQMQMHGAPTSDNSAQPNSPLQVRPAKRYIPVDLPLPFIRLCECWHSTPRQILASLVDAFARQYAD